MDWIEEVRRNLQRKNQLLFTKNSPYLQELDLLFQDQSHRVMVLWALAFAAQSVEQLAERYPYERRPWEALEAARDWAAGKIKMRLAQRCILDCHGFAKELDCPADIAACHAVGQACAVVHTAGHAMGYPIYDLSSIVYRLGLENCTAAVEAQKQAYIEALLYWKEHIDDCMLEWAPFIKE